MERPAFLDFGNSMLKACFQQQIATFVYETGWMEQLRQWLQQRQPTAIVIASVTPHRLETFLRSASSTLHSTLHILTPKIVQQHSPLHWNRVTGIGLDRMLCLSAGVEKFGVPCIVVAAGTAITLTVANTRYECLGGAILPGFALQLRCLAHFTEQLPMLSPHLPTTAIGNTPPTAIYSGVFYGIAGAINHLLTIYQAQLESMPTLVLTGGDAKFLQDLLPEYQWQYEPLLLFDAMQQLFPLVSSK